MKTLISILVVLGTSLAVFFNAPHVKQSHEDHRSCNCSGTFCGCTVSCLDEGEIPSCVCGVFSCTCVCHPKDQTSYVTGDLPDMSPTQESNSIKAENYFRSKGFSTFVGIANGIRTLRESIKSNDITSYQNAAKTTEEAFSKLPQVDKDAYATWLSSNLK